jgi:ABC transporter substrate binding protein (PQQ-dependent alcohol dehydrogenase system)
VEDHRLDSQHLHGRPEEENLVMPQRALPLATLLLLAVARSLWAQGGVGEPAQLATATLTYLSRQAPEDTRGSLTEPVVADYGWLGASFGVSELNANGRFLGKQFALTRIVLSPQEDLRKRVRTVLGARPSLIVADLDAADLQTVADLGESRGSVIIDARTSDDALREKQCRSNVFHVLPSFEARAAALSAFLVRKEWRHWLLLSGATQEDVNYSNALRRAARGGGAVIVGEKPLPVAGTGNPLTQAQLEARLTALTRTSAPYDVVLVADSSDASGDSVMFNTAASRLVAGTQGLRAVAWDPRFRDFAARGFAYRFAKFASREMTERDFGNWLAVTVFGEAVLRGEVLQPSAVGQYLLSGRFSVAAFKGQPLTFGSRGQQLRQPILLFGPKVLVALMPPADTGQGAGGGAAASRCDLATMSTG